MLQSMRRFTNSIVSQIFLGLLAMSFAVWGIADVFRGNVSDTVATVGPIAISSGEFKNSYDLALRRYQMETGQSLTAEQAKALDVGNQTLQQMITRAALDNLANSMGLVTSDAQVSTTIRADRSFAGPLGTFDKATFNQIVSEMGMNEARYIEVVRGDLTRQQLVAPLEAGFQIPDRYLEALFAAGNEARAVHYVVLTPAAVPAPPPPSDAVLAAYEKAHAGAFSTPEYRSVDFAWIGPDDVMSGVQVTDQQIQQAYEANRATYVVPETRDLEQINFPTEADAVAARAKIDQGQSFAQIAAARGLKPADIALGARVEADLPAEEAKAVFALPAGGVTQPVKGAFGYALLHVTKITPGSTKTLAEATPELKTQIAGELAQAKIVDITNAYSDALGAGDSVAEAAKKTGMHYGHVAAMDAQGLGPDGKPTAAPTDPTFLAQVFKADIGDASDPFQGKDGRSYAINVEGTTPPKLKPLSDVRDQVLAAWTAEQRDAALKKKADAYVADANKTQSLDDVAKALGVSVQTSPALTRRSADDTFSADFVKALFDAAPGAAFEGPLGKGDGIVIARVTGIAHPQLATNSPIFQQGKAAVSQTMAGDVTISLANDTRQRQGVTINRTLVDQTTGQSGS